MTHRSSFCQFACVSLLGLAGTTACGSDGSGKSVAPPETVDEFAAAPDGASRVTLTLDTFDLGPGAEVYKCQNFVNPFGRDVAILQSQSTMSKGSHHLAVFRNDESVDGSLEDCSGLEFHAELHAAQTPKAITTYPEGVGLFHLGTDGVRLNAHYFNLTGETITPKIQVVLDYVDADAVTYKAGQVSMNDSTLDIPPGQGTGGGIFTIPDVVGDIKIISVQSHMHRRAVHFESGLEGDAAFYDTTSWHEPPVKTFAPGMPLSPGDKVSVRCDFENETSEHIKFGESADRNEMCVLTGVYYPAPDGQTLVGDLAVGPMWLLR